MLNRTHHTSIYSLGANELSQRNEKFLQKRKNLQSERSIALLHEKLFKRRKIGKRKLFFFVISYMLMAYIVTAPTTKKNPTALITTYPICTVGIEHSKITHRKVEVEIEKSKVKQWHAFAHSYMQTAFAAGIAEFSSLRVFQMNFSFRFSPHLHTLSAVIHSNDIFR